MRRQTTARIGLAAALLGAVVAYGPGASAVPAAPTAPSQAPALEVVVSGLNQPRGLWVGPFGLLLVAEAGGAGESPCLPPSPGTGNLPACYSATGGLTLAWAGHSFPLLEGLASNGNQQGTSSAGPHDIMVSEQGLQILYGFANNPEGKAALGEAAAPLGTLSAVDWQLSQRQVADLAAYEGANNPDNRPGFAGEWSNPLSMIRDGNRTLVSEAGANDILAVTADGQISVVAVLPLRQVLAPPFMGLPPGATIPMESVPTGMVRGPDGAVYVGELTGFPFPVGGARVYKIVPGAEPQVIASGFTNIMDIAHDRQGRLLVLEHATNGLLSGNPAGAVKRVEADGSITTLVGTGLTAPTAMAVSPDGSVYVSNKGTSSGAGEVVRFTP